MALSLTKGQKISLMKESGGATLTKISMGLGWDVAKKKEIDRYYWCDIRRRTAGFD